MRFARSFQQLPRQLREEPAAGELRHGRGNMARRHARILAFVVRLAGWKHCPRCAAALENDGATAHCDACGFTAYASSEPTVSALVLDDEGRVLLSRRAYEPQAGKWDLPGGFLQEGEEPLDALCRELREEAGVEVEPLELVGIWADRYGGRRRSGSDAEPLLDGANRLRRADAGGRRCRARVVPSRRPPRGTKSSLSGTSEGATLPPVKRLLVAVVVVLALAPGAGARPEVSKLLLGIMGDPARFQQTGQKSAIKHVFLGWQQGMAWGKKLDVYLPQLAPIPDAPPRHGGGRGRHAAR